MNNTYPDDSLTLHTDLYQINMMQTYWELGRADLHAVLNVTFEKCLLTTDARFCRIGTVSQLFRESDVQ